MPSLYSWIIFLHVTALLGFLLAHGASSAVAFRIRRERDPVRIAALLDLSASSYGLRQPVLNCQVDRPTHERRVRPLSWSAAQKNGKRSEHEARTDEPDPPTDYIAPTQ